MDVINFCFYIYLDIIKFEDYINIGIPYVSFSITNMEFLKVKMA